MTMARISRRNLNNNVPLRLCSAPAVHIDAQGKARLFIQKSTGEIQVVELPNASPVTGGFGAGGECLK